MRDETDGKPAKGGPSRRIVVAGDDDAVADVGQHELHAPAHDRLALEVEEKLLAPHPPREPRGKHDRGDHENVEPSGARGRAPPPANPGLLGQPPDPPPLRGPLPGRPRRALPRRARPRPPPPPPR